jgi:hypothetical protein
MIKTQKRGTPMKKIMKNLIKKLISAAFFIAFLLPVTSCLLKSAKKSESSETEKKSNLESEIKQEDFPSHFSWSGKHADPVLDTDTKKNYKTIITQASRQAADFNGKYKIAEFGAGTMANGFFIINLESGVVTEGFPFEFALDYSIDSELIIRNPENSIFDYWKDELEAGEKIPEWCITEYYRFEDEKLHLIKQVEPNQE